MLALTNSEDSKNTSDMTSPASTFPLPKLPYVPLKELLSAHDCIDLFKHSLISKKSKQRVVMLNLKANAIKIRLESIKLFVNIQMKDRTDDLVFVFYEPARQIFGTAPINLPSRVNIIHYENGPPEIFIFNNDKLNLKEWIEHIFDVYHHTKFDTVSFRGVNDSYSIDSIGDFLSEVERLKINLHKEKKYKFLNRIFGLMHQVRELSLVDVNFMNGARKRWTLSRNYEALRYFPTNEPNTCNNCTLEDVFNTNCEYLIVRNTSLTAENLNTFLKRWIDGWNPKLIFVQVCILNDPELNPDVVFRGITNERIDPETRTIVPVPKSFFGVAQLKVFGNYKIKRNDGTESIILLKNGGRKRGFYFSVMK